MTDEQRKRLTKPYKEHLREQLRTPEDYRGYLDACYKEGSETFALAVRDVLEFAATSMRSRCVEKVKEMRDEWESKRNGLEPLSKMRNRYDAGFCAANEIITALESLPLEQGEQEKKRC